ncbi:MAG: hypothetical protein HYZ54_12515 [Ignavibacteriae bacterium]|nr:hypothetical protein [Ignavibacteriota bacterium]
MDILTTLRNSFLKFFGDIKIFKFPFFLLYDPGSYKVKGYEIRNIIDTIMKGDILVRGYANYLDGYFIPGFFSHAGLYLGKTQKSDMELSIELEDKFYEGTQVVMHSMAEGVFMEDIINFCKCDFLLILRRNKRAEPDIDFESSFKTVYQKALECLGKNYDFKFDFSDTGNLSCTEFVYVTNEDFLHRYNVSIKERKIFFGKKKLLIPDDFVTKEFDIVFSSKSIKNVIIEKILERNNVLVK